LIPTGCDIVSGASTTGGRTYGEASTLAGPGAQIARRGIADSLLSATAGSRRAARLNAVNKAFPARVSQFMINGVPSCDWDPIEASIIMSLDTGRTQLNTAYKDLLQLYEESKLYWNDGVRREFDERYWVNLEQGIVAAIAAIDRLSQSLNEAKRDCSERFL